MALPYGVTGGSIGEDKGRLDFDMPEPPDDVAAIEARLNDYVAAGLPVDRGVDHRGGARGPAGDGQDDEGQAARSARAGCGWSGSAPATDTIDLQPCGGTHVRSTGEIGRLRIGKIEKKGRENRRVNLHFAD